jgi:FKBP-type peptidyl-prolyl cis-trans isomerase FkpA/FKBP-type peptidyl-prolyl cis-trans isomerase FklB
MKILASLVSLALLVSVGVATAADPKTDDDKTLYALGIALSRNLAIFELKPSELEFVQQGLADGVLNKDKKVDFDAYSGKIQNLAKARAAVAAEGEKKAAADFLEKAAAEPGAKKTASGLIYKEIKPGTGDTPKASDRVKVHYHGTLRDGTVFDSSVKRGEPATFPLSGVIPCWTEGVQLMKVGGKSKLVCPSSIAYGDRGSPPNIKPGAPLVFEVELIEIVKQ